MQPTISPFDSNLDANAANYTELSPLSFLRRTAAIYPDKIAVIHGDLRRSYREMDTRVRRMASFLTKRGIGKGDTVSIIAPNIPELLEAHYAVPMAGAVLNALNTRLDAGTIAFILDHAETEILLAERSFAGVVKETLERLGRKLPIIDIEDPMEPAADPIGDLGYEDVLAEGDPDFMPAGPLNEWDAISLNYTSGTTGNPKGVVYHHRGAYLNAVGNAIAFELGRDSVYLWTLPMFHCNGWTYPWAVTLAGGTHVCLREIDPAMIFELAAVHEVTHMCAAPVVLTMLIHAPEEVKRSFAHSRVAIATGGASPPSAVIRGMEECGFDVTHLYGMTECYGPAALCAWQPGWESLDDEARTGMMARQGVAYATLEEQTVLDTESGKPVPADGETIGELALRGNTVMRGYLKNPTATEEAFADGWLHTGDLAVMHEDGYVEIKDRAKDIIISGGENISSLEVEEVLYRHPAIMEAAVVARPDEKWGETPCAFVTLVDGGTLDVEGVMDWCRENMANFKIPRTVVFGDLPKTSTGKIQKFVLRERAESM